ncbi:signal peptidase II [Clostridium sp. chh4-2]|uniref:signal peptidase II n=1 Tax=Clostridium sp. chh4-2 TaxID=2067550 RepID=UPI000CCF4047|nr:signal peptidase II [Clostridium sp. chh4-2]PNV63789.1 signal peptidase II [Clostridium sp. chh4-2]
MHKTKHIIWFLLGTVLAVAFDQWTKWMAVLHLSDNPPFVLWDGVFELHYSTNDGAAWGMLSGRQGFFFLVAVVVAALVAYTLYKMPTDKKYLPLEICMMLILSGALGNMVDRVSQGYVVDFLYFKLINFPIFNVADCYVTIATALLLILLFFRYSEEDLAFFSWKKKGA